MTKHIAVVAFLAAILAPAASSGAFPTPRVAYRAAGGSLVAISPVAATGAPLPRALLLVPGIYTFEGASYRMTSGGLYRFVDIATGNQQQRIVYAGNVRTLMSAASWITSHGSRDDRDSPAELEKKALESKLLVTCGTAVRLAADLLSQEGIASETVHTVTAGIPNGVDDGHIMVEADTGGRRTLYDIDNNVSFALDGHALSATEFAEAVQQNRPYSIIPLAADSAVDVNGWRYDFYAEYVDANLRSWYRHVVGSVRETPNT